MSHRALAAFLVFAFVASTGDAQSSSQTLPVGLDTIDGDSSTSFPFGNTNTHIWHWIYDTSNFVATTPILITAVSVRTQGTATGGTTPNVEITMSSATINWSVGSTGVQTFAANMHTDAALVYNGPVTFAAGANPVPAPWVTIPLSNAFFYDPAAGLDFIIQVRTPGPGIVAIGALDGHNNGNATRYGNQTNANSLVSSFNNPAFVPVVKIDYIPAVGFQLIAQTTGGGTGDLTLTGVLSSSHPTAVRGYTLVSFTPATPVGSGPLAGIIPDSVTWPILFLAPSVGNPLHYLNMPGFYPDVPFAVPAGVLTSLTGITANFVQIGFGAFDEFVFKSNVAACTF